MTRTLTFALTTAGQHPARSPVPSAEETSMHGRMTTARQISPGGYARRAGTASAEEPPSYGNFRARQPCIAVRTPPFAGPPGHSRAGDWPLQSFLELGALPGAVPCARLHARHVVREWGLAALGDGTELAVSELMTNAVQVSRAMSQAAPVRLWLLSDGAQLVILVWDASPQPPVRLDAGDDAENGRGLLLVDAVSTGWGWQFPPDMGGKTVWALLG